MRRLKLISVLIMVAFMCVACGGWQTAVVKGYKAAGILGKSYYDTAKPLCDQGLVPADKCAQAKDINNKARAVYIKAGNSLALAIKVDDSIQRQQFLAEYDAFMKEFNLELLDLVKLLKDLKIIK
jgi:hypothetical protein